MTSEDRDLLQSLRQQQAELQQTLAGLNAQLGALEARSGGVGPGPAAVLPPLPPEAFLPPLPADGTMLPSFVLPPIPGPGLPPVPSAAPPGRSFESHFGAWLMGTGAFILVVGLAFVLAWSKTQEVLGHAGLLAISAAVSIFMVIVGERLERGEGARKFFGRCLTFVALAWLYVTALAACYAPPIRIISSPLIAGLLLLLWSIYVLLQAERRKSQFLGVFAVALAYLSTTLNPIGAFTMACDLIFAATAAIFLVRLGWAALAGVALAGSYLALVHRLLVDENGEVILDTSRALAFWPYAIYLITAWIMFTGATIVTTTGTFRGGKRMLFLSANNAAVALLLALTTHIAGYGFGTTGWTLLLTGFVFLVTSRLASFTEIDPVEVMGAYAAQGLALLTAGLMIVFTGVSRAVALLIETFLLGVAGTFAGDRILIVSTYVSASFATLFLLWEIGVNHHHPWLLGFTGALVMVINAWSCRGEVRHSRVARTTVVASTCCYCLMAIALVFTAIYMRLDDSVVPPALAFAALALTFSINYFSIYELPGAAQILLLAAIVLVLFPVETGEDLPWWSLFWVGAITLYLVTWWARQNFIRMNATIVAVSFLYALALAALAHQAVRPYLDAQGWIVGASLLSVVFLVYGAFSRVWAIAVVGQIFLGLALYHLFFPPSRAVFPWTWWAGAVPIMVAFTSARAAHEWLRIYSDFPKAYRGPIRTLAYIYQLIALAGLCRLFFGIIPAGEQMSAFLFLGTLVLSTSVRQASTFGVRCSFIPSLIGMGLFCASAYQGHAVATFLNGLAMFLLLSQVALLRHEKRSLVTPFETWSLLLLAVLTNWIVVSACIWTRLTPAYLTMGWALFGLFLFCFGLAVQEKRLRWSGMVVVVASILRVLLHDLWDLSGGYRALTFLLVAFILIAIGYLILRQAGTPPTEAPADQ